MLERVLEDILHILEDILHTPDIVVDEVVEALLIKSELLDSKFEPY